MANGNRTRWMRACLCACVAAFGASAIEYVFPAGANVVDISKPPYSCDRTGTTDVSATLTKVLGDDSRDLFGWGCPVVYMPNGTYLVRNTVQWRFPPYSVGPHLVGQSRSGVVIKLAKGTWPLGTENKAVIQTGNGVAQDFNRGLCNLTVLVDSNNAGAYGVYWYANNEGLMSDVNIISADGKGLQGLHLGQWQLTNGGEQGPCLARRIYIKGFGIGIFSSALNSVTLSEIRLEGQWKQGIYVEKDPCYIDGLITNDTCVALWAAGPTVLTNAVLNNGGSSQYGIRVVGQKVFYCADVTSTGYRSAIVSSYNNPATPVSSIREFTPTPAVTLFPSPSRSIHLPTKYPPEVAWESDMSKWAIVDDYKTGGRTDAQALQAAIDDPAKTTVCLPRLKTYTINQAVHLRGTINRIFGTGGTLNGPGGSLIVDDGAAPIVMLQKIGNNLNNFPIIKNTMRTLVVESDLAGPIQILAGGETYISDAVVSLDVNHPQAKVWAWHFDAEGSGDDNLIVRSGTVRIFGWKDEGTGQPMHCLGGTTELLGFIEYSNANNHNGMFLAEVANNANVSIAVMSQTNFVNTYYSSLIKETRSGVTKTLMSTANSNGYNVSLYTAYDSASVLQSAKKPAARTNDKNIGIVAFRTARGTEVWYRTARAAPALILAYDPAGRIIAVVNEPSTTAGVHRAVLPHTAGVAYAEVRAEGSSIGRMAVEKE
jgi:hypothetical protein